ncbi:MAG: hypothetical protein ACP5HD_07810 [Thermoproteus sp.]
MAKKKESKTGRRRNRKIFVIALLAIIFAEVGWILGTMPGFRLSFGPRVQTPTLAGLLENTQMWVLTQRGYAPSGLQPPLYNNSIVIVTVSGVQLPRSLLNSTVPVYVLMIDPFYGPYSFTAANYFYNTLFGGNYTVASRYRDRIFLLMPGDQQSQATAVFQWIGEALAMGNATITATSAQQALSQLLSYLPIVARVSGGKVVSVSLGATG